MPIDERLAKKGRGENRSALLQQARVSIELAKNNKDPLDQDGGWTPEDTAALIADEQELKSKAAEQADAYESTLALTRSEVVARAAAKAFIRKIRLGLPRALRDVPDSGLTESSFKSGELGKSTRKITDYLNMIRPHVLKLEAGFARYFRGTTATAALDTVVADLEASDAQQESALDELPAGTQKVYELKGRLLERIEDLNRSGKIAFDGNAAEIAKFNKDILLRARKTKKEEAKTESDAEKDEA